MNKYYLNLQLCTEVSFCVFLKQFSLIFPLFSFFFFFLLVYLRQSNITL